MLRKGWNAVQLTNAISGPTKTVQYVLQDLGAKVATGANAVRTTTMAAGSTILSGVAKFLKPFGIIGGIIAGALEVFTGDISEALNPEGGFFNRLGGIVTAFFTAIPNMVFDTFAFVFGDNALARVRNGFDIIVSFMNLAVKDFLGRAFGGIADLLKKILPDDSKLVNMLDNIRNGLEDSAMANAQAMEKLMADETLTLGKLSNRKSTSGSS